MRYKKIRFNGQLLIDLMQRGETVKFKVLQGLPEGTKFVYSTPDLLMGVWIVVEHESFPLLNDGDEIPQLHDLIFEKIY